MHFGRCHWIRLLSFTYGLTRFIWKPNFEDSDWHFRCRYDSVDANRLIEVQFLSVNLPKFVTELTISLYGGSIGFELDT